MTITQQTTHGHLETTDLHFLRMAADCLVLVPRLLFTICNITQERMGFLLESVLFVFHALSGSFPSTLSSPA